MVPNRFGSDSAVAAPTWPIGSPIPENGADFWNDTALHYGNWHIIQAQADAVVDLTGSNWGGSTITAVPIPKGTTLVGFFPAIKLASGSVVAYRRLQP